MTDSTIAVLAPSVYVSITIEEGLQPEDEVHIHAGGQGIWVARMLRQFGHDPTVCAPVGGEAGETLLGLTGSWGIDLTPVWVTAPTPAYVHDRRGGERIEVARARVPELHRHEVDEFTNRILELALGARACVVTGPVADGQLPFDVYRRLGADLASAQVKVVGDLHGEALTAFLDGGPIDVLKVSAGDLHADGLLDDAAIDDDGREDLVADAIDHLLGMGVASVVVSRGDRPALARLADGRYRLVAGPSLAVVDPAGSGDSMTAALAAALVDGLDPEQGLRNAWAAGAANVTRHGLGSGIHELIHVLAQRTVLEPWDRGLDAPSASSPTPEPTEAA